MNHAADLGNLEVRGRCCLWAVKSATMQVNRRLESLEKNSGEGDPGFPKHQWPPLELCPLCRLPALNKKADVTWNEEEVYRFNSGLQTLILLLTLCLPFCRELQAQ